MQYFNVVTEVLSNVIIVRKVLTNESCHCTFSDKWHVNLREKMVITYPV